MSKVPMIQSSLERAQISRGISGHDRYWLAIQGLEETVRNAKSILDIGCGTGYFGAFLRQEMSFKGRLTGSDIHRYEPFPTDIYDHWHPWNLNDPAGAPEESFDVIFVVEALHCTESPRQVIKSLAARLRPGGTLAFVTANPLSAISITTLIFRGMFRDFQDHPDGYRYPTQLTPILPMDATRMLAECGLEERRIDFSNRLRLPSRLSFLQSVTSSLGGRWFSDCYRACATSGAK
jgi:SAM-dependent methyltransferase